MVTAHQTRLQAHTLGAQKRSRPGAEVREKWEMGE